MNASKNGQNVTLSDLWLIYKEERLGYLAPKTQENYTNAAKLIPAAGKDVRAYEAQDIAKLLKPLPPGSYMVARSFFSALMTFGIRRGLRGDNPVRYVETKKLGKARRWPRDAVYGAIALVSDAESRLVLETMYESAQRLSDVLALRKSDFQGNTISIVQKKTGNKVSVPLSADLTKRLFEVSGERDKVFQAKAAKVWADWRKARDGESTLSSLTPHGLRKAASCEAAEGGATEGELQALLGHKTPRAAAIYRLEADRAVMASSAMSKRALSRGNIDV